MSRMSCRIPVVVVTFAFLVPTPVGAQTPETTTAEQAAPQNTAVVPNLNPGFARRHDEFVEIAKRGDIDVLFMGDSITDFWRSEGFRGRRGRRGRGGGRGGRGGQAEQSEQAEPGAVAENENRPYGGKPVFDKYFGSMKVANFGIAGDTTQGVLWRLQNGEGQGFQPKAVMLMIGTNNTRRNTAAEIAAGVTAVVDELHKDFPAAKVLLLGIFPRGGPDDRNRPKIAEINTIIAKLGDRDYVTYLDIGDKFLAEDGTIPRDIMSDALHPTTKGYEIWAEAVKEPLGRLVAGEED